MPVDESELSDPVIATILSAIQELGKPVLTLGEFRSLLRGLRPKGIKPKAMERILEKAGTIHARILKSDQYADVKRVSIPSLDPTPYHYAISLRGDTYLSHGSAVFMLGLTQQQLKTIYVNKEQGKKPPPDGALSQEAIDRAFARPQRRSNYVFKIDGFQIVLLSGKATGRAGVVRDQTTLLPLTCLERTLIDIAVRPRYAGGVYQVSQAFKEAVKDIDASALISLLGVLDYRYPYHQALGFYLERAGADKQLLNRLRDFGLQFNFYLDYSMAEPVFDPSWHVFHPLGM
jgi:hypothetical protein